MENLENLLINKEVFVEARLHAGSDSSSAQSQLYEGTYKGTDSLGNKYVLVLENASYYCHAGVSWNDAEKGGFPNSSQVHTDMLAIPLDSVMHICLARNAEKSLVK